MGDRRPDPADDLQLAIDWYLDVVPASVYTGYGPPPDPDAVERALADIADALAPLTLPPEIAWFWRTWDPDAFDVVPYPHLTRPDFALRAWHDNVRDLAMARALFPIAYESHGFLFAELGGDDGVSAPLWYYAFTDEVVELRHASLAALFRTCAEALGASGQAVSSGDDRWEMTNEVFDGPAFALARERHLAAAGLDGRPRQIVPDDASAWPEQWRRVEGLTEDDLQPRGSTHTIAEFVAAASSSAPLTARLRGRWVAHAGGGIGLDGAVVTVGTLVDDTGMVSLVLPGSVLWIGNRYADGEVEVEVAADQPVGADPVVDTAGITAAALSGDSDGAAAQATDLARSLEETVRQLPTITRVMTVA